MSQTLFSRHAFMHYDQLTQALLLELQTMAADVLELLERLTGSIAGSGADTAGAKRIDRRINRSEQDIVTHLHHILGKFSPSLNELRFLIATVRLAAALERMGDIAKMNISRCERLREDDGSWPEGFATEALSMIAITCNLLKDAMYNLTHFDQQAVVAMLTEDERVNQSYHALIDGLCLLPKQHPLLPVILKHIERSADIAFEIGRIVHFAHTGQTPAKKQIRLGDV